LFPGAEVATCLRSALKRHTRSMPSCIIGEGEKPHPALYWGCSHAKEELQRRRAQAPKESSGRTFTSPEQFFAAALYRDMQRQQPQALKTDEISLQQHLSQQESQRTDLSVQAPSSSKNDMLKVTCNAAEHDRAQWSCIRGQNNGHYKSS
jgi:hypothetical protein